jgi:thioredoxin reductase (NADPH)
MDINLKVGEEHNITRGQIKTDSVIIGAGPVGLFQAFELGLLEIKTHIIDSLPAIGGQCTELYPEKPIYDIPGIPVCTGKELINNLLKQIEPFKVNFHLNQEVKKVSCLDDNLFELETSSGIRFITKTIFIAAGVGSFQPRPLSVEGIEQFENTQLFYSIKDPENFRGKKIVICGGSDSALDWALYLAEKSESVVLLHRSTELRASPKSVSKMKALCEAKKMQFIAGQVSGYKTRNNKLNEVEITGQDNTVSCVQLDFLLVFFGLSPKLGPISEWGLDLERKQLKVVNTEKFETSVPGIFAIGDINTYPGKKKLILSGFHEAALAAFAAAAYIFPEKKIQMQYTTTSPKIRKILGV